MMRVLFCQFKYFKDTVADIPVVNVFAFVLLEPSDDKGGKREKDDLIDGLKDKLQQQLVQQFLPCQDSKESDGEEQQGICCFSGDGTQDESSGKLLPSGPYLHATEHPGIDETSGKESDAGSPSR